MLFVQNVCALLFFPSESVSQRGEGPLARLSHSHFSSWPGKWGNQPKHPSPPPPLQFSLACPIERAFSKTANKEDSFRETGQRLKGKGQKGLSLSFPLRCIQKAVLRFLGLWNAFWVETQYPPHRACRESNGRQQKLTVILFILQTLLTHLMRWCKNI